MPQALKATYRNGVFTLQTVYELPDRNGAFTLQTVYELTEGSEVELLIQSPQVISPPISDPKTRQQLLKSLVKRMQQNPIPLNAPQFTREELHERC